MKHLRVSLETIQYQYKDDFPVTLENYVSSIYDGIAKKKWANNAVLISKAPEIAKIELLIMNRLGLNVVFDKHMTGFSSAAIVPFFRDYLGEASNISQSAKEVVTGTSGLSGTNLSKAILRINAVLKEKKQAIKKLHGKTGTVNRKLAKVTGYLSEIRHYLIIDFMAMKFYGLTAGELTAVILHELGHAFDGIEEHHRLESTNSSIVDILDDLSANRKDEAVRRFKLTFTKEEFEKDITSDSVEEIDFCGKLALAYMGEVKSQLLDAKYDESNFENMADTFAARFGMGDQLVSGLQKIYQKTNSVLPNSKSLFFALYSIDVAILASTFLLFGVAGGLVFNGIILLFFSGTDNNSRVYDDPVERYTRIKNTVINAMKGVEVDKENLSVLLDQYEYIEEIIQKSNNRPDMFTDIADVIRPSARKARYYIDLQRSIENSLNNKLFVKSAQLKVL